MLALFAWVCGGAVACSPEDRDFGSPSGGTGVSQHPDDGSEDDSHSPNTPGQSDDENDPTTQTMKLKLMIGSREFTATLADNAASRAFWDLLPLELDMIEMNGNEKYGNLPQSLPADVHYPGTISTGDLCCGETVRWFSFTRPFRRRTAIRCLGVWMLPRTLPKLSVGATYA